MSNYTQTTAFTPKDTLASGNPAKVIKGADFDVEFGAISTSIATKADTTALTPLTAHTVDTTNPHNVTKTQVGLGNVDNTSDANKPVSTATQTALNAKQDTLVSGTTIKTVNSASILGAGDLTVQATLVSGTNIKTVNGNSLLGSGNLALDVGTGDVTGPVSSTDNTLPRFDGTTGKLLQGSTVSVDDSGNMTLAGATLTYQKSPVSVTSGTFTCTAGIAYILTGSSTATLPASPAAGTWVTFVNRSGLLTCTIARNGQNIMGLAEDMTLDSLNACVTLTFADATRGWVIS